MSAMNVLFKLLPRLTASYGRRRMCTLSNDLVRQQIHSQDILLANLKNSPSTKSVLEIVAKHHKIMNSKHVMQALRTLFTLQKHGSSEISTNQIIRHRDFEKLCNALKSQAGVIDLHETIEALKVVTYVGVPSNSTITQVLLQLIRQNINNLNLHQIIFLEFLLTQYSSTPLVEALKIALPMVFEIQLPVKMDRDNITYLKDYLFYASRNNLSEGTNQLIMDAMTKYREPFSVQTAKSIIWSLCDMQPKDYFEPLLKKSMAELIIHLDDLTYTEIETTITKLVNAYNKSFPFFYDEVLFDSCVNQVIDKDLGFKHATYLLRKYRKMCHFNSYLLNYICKKVEENPELILKGDVCDIYNIAIAVSMTDYRPPLWDTVKSLILEVENLTRQNRKEILWLKFGASLSLLQIFKEDVLKKSLDDHLLFHMSKRKYVGDYDLFITICNAIKLFKPELSYLIPHNFQPIDAVEKMLPIPDFPLEGALYKAFGGRNYVKTGLISQEGYQIDHAVVFRKGGYPVAMASDDIKYIEDLVIPADHQLLLILCLRPIHFTINTKELKGTMSLAINILEENDNVVVTVNLEKWEALQDFEKIPYLMQLVKEKKFNEKETQTAFR